VLSLHAILLLIYYLTPLPLSMLHSYPLKQNLHLHFSLFFQAKQIINLLINCIIQLLVISVWHAMFLYQCTQ
jgi:hypothetical protein